MSKQDQRQIIRAQLRELTSQQMEFYSCTIVNRLLENEILLKAKNVLSYLAMNNEVNLDVLNEKLEQSGINIAYPVVIDNNKMEAYIPLNNELKVGAFGIREPIMDKAILLNKEEIDVVIVPCVGFDEDCHRLGHGNGYYDHYLQGCKCYKICVGFEAQKLKRIETDSYDITMDAVVSEQQIYYKK